MANKTKSTTDYGFRMSRKMRNYMLKNQKEDFKEVKMMKPDEQMALEPQLRNLYRKYDGKNFQKATKVSMPAASDNYRQPLRLTPRSELPAFKSRIDDAIEGRSSDKGSGKSKDGKSSKDSRVTKSFSKTKTAKREDWIVPNKFYELDKGTYYEIGEGNAEKGKHGWELLDLQMHMSRTTPESKIYLYEKWPAKNDFEKSLRKGTKPEDFGIKPDTRVKTKFSRDLPLKGLEITQFRVGGKPSKTIILMRRFGSKPKNQEVKKDKDKKGKDKKGKGKKDKGKFIPTLTFYNKAKGTYALRDKNQKVLNGKIYSSYAKAQKASKDKYGVDAKISQSVEESFTNKFTESRGDGRPT